MVAAQIRVDGLAALRRDLTRAGQIEARNDLRDGLKAAAAIGAAEGARLASAFSSTAAATIRPRAGGNKAFIVGGKAKLPWYGWADFGSRTPVQGNPRSVGPWKGSGAGPAKGRFIYPAIDNKERAMTEVVADAVTQALRKLDL